MLNDPVSLRVRNENCYSSRLHVRLKLILDHGTGEFDLRATYAEGIETEATLAALQARDAIAALDRERTSRELKRIHAALRAGVGPEEEARLLSELRELARKKHKVQDEPDES